VALIEHQNKLSLSGYKRKGTQRTNNPTLADKKGSKSNGRANTNESAQRFTDSSCGHFDTSVSGLQKKTEKKKSAHKLGECHHFYAIHKMMLALSSVWSTEVALKSAMVQSFGGEELCARNHLCSVCRKRAATTASASAAVRWFLFWVVIDKVRLPTHEKYHLASQPPQQILRSPLLRIGREGLLLFSMITSGVGICVRFTPDRGRGVFATKSFEYGDLIEKCPVIVLSWFVVFSYFRHFYAGSICL
jgi:hypothetical protein